MIGSVPLLRCRPNLLRLTAANDDHGHSQYMEEPDKAHDVDRKVLYLSDTDWEEFVAILNRPPQRLPELAALLNKPAPWNEA